MKNFIRKFKEKFKEYYAFRFMIYNMLFMIVVFIMIMLSDLHIIFAFILIPILILWILNVARPNNKIVEIRSRILKELEVEKLVNDAYIKENIK